MSSSSHNPAYVPGPRFGFVKLLASSGSHCTKWADEQHRLAGFESRLVPDLPLPFIPTLIGLRAFDLVSSPVWWEAATNKQSSPWTLYGVWVWPFLSSCWVAFGWPSYLWAVLPGVPQHWRFPPASGGHPPRFYPLRGVIAWRLRRPKKRNADGAEGIFGLAGRVWASALRPGPP